VEDRVRTARTAELGARKRFWDRFAIVVSVTNMTLNLLSLFTLGTYSIIFFLGHGPPLSTARLFTAYATLTIISASLFAIGQGLPAVTQAYVSVRRIERYLSSPDSKHHADQDSAHFDSKNISKSLEPMLDVSEKPRTVFLHVESSSSSLSAAVRGEREETLIIDAARIGWSDKVVLDGLDVTICLEQLTMVIGRVASVSLTFIELRIYEEEIIRENPRC
jgi:ABC-type multidrug transport system fused ATPase/permease subunit